MDQSENVTATVRIAATPAEVFPYLVEPDLLVQWIGTSADLNPVAGGIFAVQVGDAPVRGTYVAVEPPDRVIFTWGLAGSDTLPSGCSTVEILLEAEGDETVVRLTHRDLPPDWRPQHQAGWAENLETLRRRATS